MTKPSHTPDGTSAGPPPADRPARGRWQVGLRTLFLLICAAAAWLAVIGNREKTRAMQERIDVLRPLARELEVDDPASIAVVKKLDQWMDEDRWELYLPPGRYRICMATREVRETGFPPTMKSAPIGPGRHRLALDQRTGGESWKGVLTCDGSERLTIEEPESFPGDGSMTSEEISLSEQFPADRPVVLSRCQFKDSPAGGGSATPTAASNGLMIWIESDPAAAPPR